MRRLLAAVAVAVIVACLVVMTVACTPEEVAVFRTLTPAQQQAVIAHLAARNRSTDCYQAIDRHWPAESRAWARSIVWRESRNTPTAASVSSTSRGCWQLLLSLHSWRFSAVGCSASQWADPDCNTLAALHLYREAGTSPWRVW